MKTASRNTYALAKYFIASYPRESFLAVFALLLAGIIETLGIGALLPLITIIIGGESAPDNTLSMIVFKIFNFLNIEPVLPNLLCLIVLTISLKAIIVFQAMRYVSYIATDVARDLRLKLIDSLMKAEWTYFSSLSIGKIANTISSEANRAGNCYLLFGRTVSAFLQTILYIGAAFLVSWKVSLVAVTMGLLIGFLVRGFIKMARQAGSNLSQYMNQMLTQLNESLSGIKPLKAMRQEDNYISKLNKLTVSVMQAQKKQDLSNLLLQIIYEPMAVILLAAGLFYILTYTTTSVESVLLLAFLFYRLLTHTNLLQKFYQNMVQNEAAVWGIIDATTQAKNHEEFLQKGSQPIFKERITANNISIGYNNTNIIESFSAQIPKNKLIVLFGPSGAGKTSFIDALLGLIKIRDGSILIDDVSLSDIDLNLWREKIGYVPQETFLFHDSIEQNVTLGNTNFSEEQITRALKQADAYNFINEMPDKTGTIVGERGGKLSGGQRQRIALARALIRNPELLILDESTTGLDHESEKQILQILKNLSKDITIIMISHNTKILDIADHVIKLEKNKI